MNLEDLRRAIKKEQTSEELRLCVRAIESRRVAELPHSPGRLKAWDALATFTLRERTSRAANRDISGFEPLLHALSSLPREAEVLLFHFDGEGLGFSVFVDEQHGRVLGCLRIRKSAATDSSPPR